MIYKITDIRKIFDEPIKIEAKSPIEAVKNVYKNHTVTRDLTGKSGNIVVYGYAATRYGTYN